MTMRKVSQVVCALLCLVATREFPVSAQAHVAQPDLRAAAAAKAAAGINAAGGNGIGNVPRADAIGTFASFDVPGAGTSSSQGTFPSAINPEGAVTGSFVDANSAYHGFLRAGSGAITAFDVPGAGSGAFQGTFPSGINPEGAISGSFVDANSVYHEFLRTGSGAITAFDVPGALFFLTSSINATGATAGTYFDANFVPHAFLRTSSGAISTFDAPGAVNGTQAVGITPRGEIAGIYTDAALVHHGFVRASGGAFTTFDVPAGQINSFAPFSFGPDLSMTPAGAITGTYFQPVQGNPFGGNYRVFVRALDGTFTTFDAATYPPCCIWSFPSGITPGGAIVGSFNDGLTINHGFLRAHDGAIATFDAPGAGSGFNQGTAPLGITPGGTIMGLYVDANYVTHGFVLTPVPSVLNASH